MKKALTTAAIICAVPSSPLHAQWHGDGCGQQPAHVTINRYNYYGHSASGCSPAYTGWRGAPQTGGHVGLGRPLNLVAGVLSVLDIFRVLFPPRRQEVFVQCPTSCQSPAPVIIER